VSDFRGSGCSLPPQGQPVLDDLAERQVDGDLVQGSSFQPNSSTEKGANGVEVNTARRM
jgi:hypothetical protein